MIDPTEILATSEFTVEVILPNRAGTVKGIFDQPSAEPFGDVYATAPKITLATTVADTLVEGDQLIIAGKDYFVKPGKYDDAGLTEIPLNT